MACESRGWRGSDGMVLEFDTEVIEEDGFGFVIPQAVVGLAACRQLGEQGIGLALFFKVVDGGQWHIELGVGQLLAAGDGGQVLGGFRDGVDAAHVGDMTEGSMMPLADSSLASMRSLLSPPVVPMMWVEV